MAKKKFKIRAKIVFNGNFLIQASSFEDYRKKVDEYYDNYNPEEEAALWYKQNRGEPSSLRELLAFQKPTNGGRCVFFDHESYWFPARPDQLTLIRKGGLR